MAFRVSGKNMDVGEALRASIGERVTEALAKYFDGTFTGHATIAREGFGYQTECVLHLSSGITLQAAGMAADAYASADAAALHLEKRLRRYKRRLKDHHLGRASAEGGEAASYVIASPDGEDREETEAPQGAYNPVIIAESTTGLKRLSVGEAVMDLDLSGVPVLVFRHAASGRLNIVYRRTDGNIGWIDPPVTGSQ